MTHGFLHPHPPGVLTSFPVLPQVVLCAEGPTFTAGLDLEHLQSLFDDSTSGSGTTCPARQRLRLGQGIRAMQAAYSALEQQPWPVIAAVDGVLSDNARLWEPRCIDWREQRRQSACVFMRGTGSRSCHCVAHAQHERPCALHHGQGHALGQAWTLSRHATCATQPKV